MMQGMRRKFKVGSVLKKFIRWISKLVIGTTLIVFMSLFITWSMVNTYLHQILQDLNIPAEYKVSLGDVLSTATTELEQWVLRTDNHTHPTSEDESKLSEETPYQEEAIEVWGREGTQQVEEQQVLLSLEDFNLKKDQMSGEDKIKIFSMLMSKLPTDEIQALSLFLEDGITQSEMELIDDMIRVYLKEEEVDTLVAILEKYN